MPGVQFNLLPDIKMKRVQAQRSKSLIVSIAFLASAVAIGVLVVVFFSVAVVQKKMLSDADADIVKYSKELKTIPDIEKKLTIQNQLNTLPDLHQKKHITSRIFSYLPVVTPSQVTISRISLDLANNTMVIDGNADSHLTVNTFIDTLKFTTYKVGDQDSGAKAFPSVTESSFAVGQGNVSYGLTISFDPALFANNLLDSEGRPQTPQLVVPQLTTTHASANNSTEKIFQDEAGQ